MQNEVILISGVMHAKALIGSSTYNDCKYSNIAVNNPDRMKKAISIHLVIANY